MSLRKRALSLFCSLFGWIAASCATELRPEVGPVIIQTGCDPEDSNPSINVSFAEQIGPLVQNRCSCHQPTSRSPIGFQATGLDLSSYAGLLRGGANSAGMAIIPRHPCESILFQKIGDSPPFGSRMPLYAVPLSDGDLQTIHDWIAEGALDN